MHAQRLRDHKKEQSRLDIEYGKRIKKTAAPVQFEDWLAEDAAALCMLNRCAGRGPGSCPGGGSPPPPCCGQSVEFPVFGLPHICEPATAPIPCTWWKGAPIGVGCPLPPPGRIGEPKPGAEDPGGPHPPSPPPIVEATLGLEGGGPQTELPGGAPRPIPIGALGPRRMGVLTTSSSSAANADEPRTLGLGERRTGELKLELLESPWTGRAIGAGRVIGPGAALLLALLAGPSLIRVDPRRPIPGASMGGA